MKGKQNIIKNGAFLKNALSLITTIYTHFRYPDSSPIRTIGLGNKSVRITMVQQYIQSLAYNLIIFYYCFVNSLFLNVNMREKIIHCKSKMIHVLLRFRWKPVHAKSIHYVDQTFGFSE